MYMATSLKREAKAATREQLGLLMAGVKEDLHV
jgi:hypothetical protein